MSSMKTPADIQVNISAGTHFETFHLHKSVLRAHSHYLKRAFDNAPLMKVIELPCGDRHGVFHVLVDFMYHGRISWDGDLMVHICELAHNLDIPQVLHLANKQLKHESTETLVKYLKTAYLGSEMFEFVTPLVAVLANRMSDPGQISIMGAALPLFLFELLLRSPVLNLKNLSRLKEIAKQYLKLRGKKEDISNKRKKDVENLTEQLDALRDMIHGPGVKCDRFIQSVRAQFYKQLETVVDLSEFVFMFKEKVELPMPAIVTQPPESEITVTVPKVPIVSRPPLRLFASRCSNAPGKLLSPKSESSLATGHTSFGSVSSTEDRSISPLTSSQGLGAATPHSRFSRSRILTPSSSEILSRSSANSKEIVDESSPLKPSNSETNFASTKSVNSPKLVRVLIQNRPFRARIILNSQD